MVECVEVLKDKEKVVGYTLRSVDKAGFKVTLNPTLLRMNMLDDRIKVSNMRLTMDNNIEVIR